MTTPGTFRRALAGLALGAFVVGCGAGTPTLSASSTASLPHTPAPTPDGGTPRESAPTAATSSGTGPTGLDGRRWVLSDTVTPAWSASLPAGVRMSLVVADGEATFAFGCNVGSAPVRADSTSVTFGAGTRTSRSCGESAEVTRVEQEAATLLSGPLDYRIDGDSLVLTRTDGTGARFASVGPSAAIMSAQVHPVPPVLVRSWQVDAVTLPGRARDIPLPDTSLQFFATGGVALGSSCDGGSATVVVAGDTLTFTDVRVPFAPCPAPPTTGPYSRISPAPAQGNQYHGTFVVWADALAGPIAYRLVGSRLTLSSPDGVTIEAYANS